MTYPASVMGSVVSYLEGKGMNAMADAVQELKAENGRLRDEIVKLTRMLTGSGIVDEQSAVPVSASYDVPLKK